MKKSLKLRAVVSPTPAIIAAARAGERTLLLSTWQIALPGDAVKFNSVDAYGGESPAGVKRHIFETAMFANQPQAIKYFLVALDNFALSKTDDAFVACRDPMCLDFVSEENVAFDAHAPVSIQHVNLHAFAGTMEIDDRLLAA